MIYEKSFILNTDNREEFRNNYVLNACKLRCRHVSESAHGFKAKFNEQITIK